MIYNHRGYELKITYNSETKQYEGKCFDVDIRLSSSNKEVLESCFRERIDDFLSND